MRSAWAERSPSAALEPRRGCPKISPPPPRVITAMFVGEIYNSIRGRIDAGKKSSPSPIGLELVVGSDLQYIRMNGTLVGAGVGALIFAASHLFRLR